MYIAAVLCIGIHRIFDLFDDGSYCCKCKIAAVCYIGIHRILIYLTIVLIVENVKLRLSAATESTASQQNLPHFNVFYSNLL
jgi:hypothetical protein